ncbi:MAG: hypothetical protein FWB78_06310, partial [Treponema sp.]|nr:hypothetical protein [Treponema sp.]
MINRIISQGSGLLRTAFFSGIMLAVIFGGGLVILYTTIGPDILRATREQVSFHRLLSDYDFRYRQVLGPGQVVNYHHLDSLSRDLDHLETRTEGVENWLSVLRRRRQLIVHAGAVPGLGPRYAEIYRQSSMRALRDFPFSEPIAAIAAAATIRDAAITREMEEELREILPRLTSTRFAPMRLDLHVLLGDFHSPERAAENLLKDGGMSLDSAISAVGQDMDAVLASLVILRILEGETWEALSAIQTAMARGQPSPDFIRFAAEFFYDFGNPVRSAELFHMLPGEDALSRQADALWLAEYTEHARHIWALLAASRTEANEATRALLNLAVTAQTREEAESLFERLVMLGRSGDTYRGMGLINFTRMLDAPRAIAFLESEMGAPGGGYVDGIPINALIELEILKRRSETGEAGRVTAETWLLLNRYPEVEGLFQWAAWYFDLQRNFAETAMLLRTAERNGLSGCWVGTHEALQLIRDGRFDTAIGRMQAIQAESPDWVLAANLGRIFEARNASA